MGPVTEHTMTYKWSRFLPREAAPVHTARAMLYSGGDAGGGSLVLGLPPHPTAAAALEESEGGLVAPQHLRPVFLGLWGFMRSLSY